MTAHRKRPRDPAQLAKFIVDVATGEVDDRGASPARAKAGAKGGSVRASHLTPEQRAEAAKLAAQARLRIPRQSGQCFRRKAATQSDPKRPPIPIEGGHPVDGVNRGPLSAV
jgi:hypothetical protein